MIRERRLNSLAYRAGSVSSVELPKDAVYHSFQIELDGNVSIAYGATPTASKYAEGFPFTLMRRVALKRNGGDTVWQGSGKQLAKESLFLNGRYPFARIWVDAASGAGTAYALLSATVNGLAVVSNSEGIGQNSVVFNDTATASTTTQIDFRCMAELWLQLGVDDSFFTTLVDARPLSSFTLEIEWAQTSEFMITGTNGTVTVTANASVQSYDQDNLKLGIPFGTFKRASNAVPGLGFSGSNTQYLLPRGNLYYGIIFEALATKSAGQGVALATIAQPGDDIVGEIQNRVNTNYLLRDVFWQDLQAKNRADQRCPSGSSPWGAGPLGWAQLYYPSTGGSVKELVATYTMDTFDLLINTYGTSGGAGATGSGSNNYGNTYTGSPTLNILTQEVIPGRSVAPNAAQGSFAGSMGSTSAKPGA
jgi:hypothetical protein